MVVITGETFGRAILHPNFRLHSPAFAYGQMIPEKYTCEGKNISPPLVIEHVPRDAKSLALVMEDPDALGKTWVHWRLWNIDRKTSEIREGSIPPGAILGLNSFGQTQYGGPCPPHGEHAYVFRVYALRQLLSLPGEATDLMFRNALLGKVISEADLLGYYRRKYR